MRRSCEGPIGAEQRKLPAAAYGKPARSDNSNAYPVACATRLRLGITGALVARQPFGGFAMSGVGSKAGGHDYLLQFVEPRAACENTLRRGFAPEL